MFLHFLTLMWYVGFHCFATCPSCATLSQVGLFELPVTYMGFIGHFFCLGSRVAKWPPLRKSIANGGSGMCSLLSLILYPKHAHSTSLTLSADYWGPGCRTPPKQVHNHNLR
jgi:hypothetical protein